MGAKEWGAEGSKVNVSNDEPTVELRVSPKPNQKARITFPNGPKTEKKTIIFPKKCLRPLFLVEKKNSSHPLFLSKKKLSAPFFISSKNSITYNYEPL